MEISLPAADRVRISANGAEILLSDGSLVIDGMAINMPGEYEKSGILATVDRFADTLFVHIVTEGRSIAYVPVTALEPSEKLSEFLGDIDVLFLPGTKDSVKVTEKLESRIVVPYGELREQFLSSLGKSDEPAKKFKPKDADFEASDVRYIFLESGE